MKISVHGPGHTDITIPLPNALLFSPTLLEICASCGAFHSDHKMPDIPKETLRRICDILKDYSKKHGSWELVQVEAASGATITITI